MKNVLHICLREAWEAAQAAGEYRGETLATEGFIHCSTAKQAAATANRYFTGQQELILLVIATDKVVPEVRFEEATNGDLFPHIYGPLNLDAVVRTIDFPPETDGTFRLPAGISVE